MASVTLEFLPPLESDIVALHVYECAVKTGPFNEIERTTAIGTYPNYVSEHTTTVAASATDWFTIQWENSAGALTPLSQPMQGGTSSLVGIITDRVMLRDAALNRNVVEQEAEFAIGDYFNVTDPFSVDPSSVNMRTMRGLITLVLVRSYLNGLISSGQANKWTAGLVSMDTSTNQTAQEKTIDRLIEMANRDLNRTYSTILLLNDVSVAGGFTQAGSQLGMVTGIDVTRGLLTVSIDSV